MSLKKQLRKDNLEAEKEVTLAIAQAQEALTAGKQRCACCGSIHQTARLSAH